MFHHRLHDQIETAFPFAAGVAATFGNLLQTFEGAMIGALFSLLVFWIKRTFEKPERTRIDDIVRREGDLEDRVQELQSVMNAAFVFQKQSIDQAALHARVNAERLTQLEDAAPTEKKGTE